MKGKYLGEFEEIVLLTVAALFKNAYGVSIRNAIMEKLDRKVGMGALHATLVRLEDKGYLSSEFGESTQKRGGKRKRFFRVTQQGHAALAQTMDTRKRLWDDVPKIAFDFRPNPSSGLLPG